MGNFFSWAQWQELELQALIYRYMLAGASVPQELLLPIKKSLIHQSPMHFLHHPLQHSFPHHQPSCQSLSPLSLVYASHIFERFFSSKKDSFCFDIGVMFPRSRNFTPKKKESIRLLCNLLRS